MSGLQWVRLDTTLPDHPKILELLEHRDGHRAAFVYVCALAYAGRIGTDGYVPAGALSRINGRRKDADLLVKVALFDPDLEGGWHIHDWSDYNGTTETSAQLSTKRALAGRKGNCVRHHGPDCFCWKLPPSETAGRTR